MNITNWFTLFAEIEAAVGPIEEFFAKHSGGPVQKVAQEAVTLTPVAAQIASAVAASPNVTGIVSALPLVVDAVHSVEGVNPQPPSPPAL